MDYSEYLVQDNAENREILRELLVSTYSAPIPSDELPSKSDDLKIQGKPVLTEVQSTTEDIIASFKELRSNSSSAPDGVPPAI